MRDLMDKEEEKRHPCWHRLGKSKRLRELEAS